MKNDETELTRRKQEVNKDGTKMTKIQEQLDKLVSELDKEKNPTEAFEK